MHEQVERELAIGLYDRHLRHGGDQGGCARVIEQRPVYEVTIQLPDRQAGDGLNCTRCQFTVDGGGEQA